MRKALIVGASGQVGGALAEALGSGNWLGTYCSTPFDGGVQLDLRDVAARPDLAAELLSRETVEVVFIAGAMTNVDACEEQRDLALAMNRDAPAALAAAARARGARSVYFSTEYVFDGSSGPYGEDDEPCPISAYGESKLEGERAVLAADPSALVVRTTVVYGPDERGRNFAYRLASELAAGRRLRAPDDQLSSPTYNRDAAAATLALVEAGERGIVNVVGPEVLDRATFARRLATAARLPAERIDGVTTDSLGQRARRPLCAGLRLERLRTALPHLPMRSVEDAVVHWTQNQRGRAWPRG